MATTERVTVTLPAQLVASIDRLERNRSRFVAQAVEHELALRRRRELMRSVENPHPESEELVAIDLGEWSAGLPPEEDLLVERDAGKPVRWVAGQGWVEDSE